MPTLVFQLYHHHQPPPDPAQIPLRPDCLPLRIGRKPPALMTTSSFVTLADDDKIVSRAHATISFDPSSRRYSIVDLASANGTIVNNIRLYPNVPAPLKIGDTVSFGGGLGVEPGLEMRNTSYITPFVYKLCADEGEDEERHGSLSLSSDVSRSKTAQVVSSITGVSNKRPLGTRDDIGDGGGGESSSRPRTTSQNRPQVTVIHDSEEETEDREPQRDSNASPTAAGRATKRSRLFRSHSIQLDDDYDETNDLVDATQTMFIDVVYSSSPSSSNSSSSISSLHSSKQPTFSASSYFHHVDTPASHSRRNSRTDTEVIDVEGSSNRKGKRKQVDAMPREVGEKVDEEVRKKNKDAGGAGAPTWLGELDSEFVCAICCDVMVVPHTVNPCGHMYCGACLDSWLKSKNTCPECRTMISREQPMIPAFKMGAVIDAYAKQTMGQEDLKERAKREIEWKQRQDRKRACERRHAKSSSSPSSPSSSPLPRRPRPLINSSFLDIFNEYWSTSGSSRRANQTPQPEPAPSPHQRLRRIGLGPRHYSQQAEGSSSTAPAPLVPRHAAPPSASAGVIGTLSSASVDGRPRYVLIKEREDANMNPNAGAGRNRSRNGSRNENGNAPMAPSPPSLSSSASSASATQSRSSSSSASATQSRSSSSSASATQSRSSSSSRSRNVISILSDDSDASSAASTPSDQAESSEPPRQPEYERITLRLPSNEEGAPRCCECREAIGPQALCYEVVPRVRAGTGVGEASEGAERRTRLYHVRCFAVPDEWRWIDPEARGRGRSRRESMGHVAADADVGTSVTRRVILDTNGMSFQQKVEARLEIL